LRGQLPPAERTYEFEERPFQVCALCWRAARDDDELAGMRLAEADVAGTDIGPGMRHVCKDCVAKWKPVIYRRREAAGDKLPPLANFGGFDLL